MEIAHYVSLHAQAVDLSKLYFIGVTHAPAVYLTLGKSLENLAFALERLCLEASHPNSPLLQPSSRQSVERVLWLALYKLSSLLFDTKGLLQRLKISKDRPPQWWLNFAQKARFGHQENFMDLIQRLNFYHWALRITTKTFNRELLSRKLETSSIWAATLENALQQQLSSAGPRGEGSSIYSGFDKAADVVQEFTTFSDYYGRDIFEAAKPMAIVRLAMYWTHRGMDALSCLEKTRSLPVEAYGNILKAGWILQRLQHDKRSRHDECAAVVVSLSEDITFELKRINELKLTLPTNESLVEEADLRIWLDDLDTCELEKKISPPAMTVSTSVDQLNPVSPTVSTSVDQLNPVSPPVSASDDQLKPVSPLFSPRQDRGSWNSPQLVTLPTLPTLPAKLDTHRRSAGSDLHMKTSSRASIDETVMRSPDSRVTSATPASTIDTQPSSVQSSQSSQQSPVSSDPGWRKPLPNMPMPTVTEPIEKVEPPTTTAQRRQTIPPNSMQYGVPPLEYMYANNKPEQTRSGEEQGSVGGPNSPTKGRKKLERSPSTNVSDLQVYDPSEPPSNFAASNFGSISRSSDRDSTPLSPIADPRDLDERPGEVEIMKNVFQSMTLLASESFHVQPVWESCSIRIFRKLEGGVRILTFRDSGIDQKFISPKDTEMVPEYGYHKDLPVIFLRKMAPDSHYQTATSQKPTIFMGAEDLSAASLYYRFDNAKDMFDFQLAFMGEAVEIDIKAVRTVRFKRSLLDGEHSNYKARVQMWREQTFDTVGSGRGGLSPGTRSIAGTIRSRGVTESILKVPSTRLVIYFEEVIVVLFVTDLIAIEARARTNVLRIKPSSYRTFGNPSSVRARFLGTRSLSGGIQLDKKGLTIDSEDSFDEFKWFEIDFYSEEEMSYFRHDFCSIINERRKDRRRAEELKLLAANGVRSSR